MNTNDQIRAISEGIIQCAIFADKPEGTNPRVTKQAIQAAEAIAARFVGVIGDELLNQAVGAYKDLIMELPGYSELECVGHDVWFTMRRHGVGFWDRDFLKVDKYGVKINPSN